jgi:hypothetical protein
MGLDHKEIDFDDIEDVEEKKANWVKSAWDYLYDEIYWKFIGWRLKEFKSSVSKLIRWLPIIWKDRDWDDHYIWELMKNKLRWQANYIAKRDWHTRAELDAKRMRLCANLMDKVQDEFYSSEYSDYHEADFNWLDVPDKPGLKELDMQTTSERFNEFFKKYPLVYKKVLMDNKLQMFSIEPRDGETEVDIKQRIAMNIGHYNHNRARKLLFKIMEENIESWWD